MWAPDVHKVKPSSALAQLCLMFGLVGVFALGVYEIRAPAPMVRPPYPSAPSHSGGTCCSPALSLSRSLSLFCGPLASTANSSRAPTRTTASSRSSRAPRTPSLPCVPLSLFPLAALLMTGSTPSTTLVRIRTRRRGQTRRIRSTTSRSRLGLLHPVVPLVPAAPPCLFVTCSVSLVFLFPITSFRVLDWRRVGGPRKLRGPLRKEEASFQQVKRKAS